MPSYFYRLGHIPELAVAELTFQNQEQVGFWRQWAVSTIYQDVRDLGSCIYSGEILFRAPKSIFFDASTKIIKEWFHTLQAKDPQKKLSLIQGIQSKISLLEVCKQAGFKKINLFKGKQQPTFGNFKKNKYWLVLFRYEDEICIGKINSFAQQSLWNILDRQLPVQDMDRGMINLKLARSMANLTRRPFMWDPFAGVGRNIIASGDKEINFLSSDKDAQCIPQIDANVKFAAEVFQRKITLLHNFQYDVSAANLPDIDYPDWKKTAVVTEGYLGKNLAGQITLFQVEKELHHQQQLWKKALQNFAQLGIPEVVFCLPFYRLKRTILPTFIEPLLAEQNFYRLQPLQENEPGIRYARNSTSIGHYVLKLVAQ